ncbi:NPC intracellular cholesterol transporter 1 [Caerostris darwini]|uniref:NPC intracellular cholesterol transporter 1 n=1 Tax=Caerostris darwini TaxID=1538125 RepID=A0AAV4NG23_9ARAC|nr:NPC intracellular cholesterol transporter 1 [Caerostris darwini]
MVMSNVECRDHCVMRGNCEIDDVTYLNRPCVYNGDPVTLKDQYAIKFLKEVCPTLETGGDFNVCCDADQVSIFQESFDALAVLFKRCPSCYHNLANLFCNLICSPRQNQFLKVTDFKTDGENKTVTEISYYITEAFAQGLFKSCKNVKLSFTKEKAIGISCGSHIRDCTPHLWLAYMGGHDPSPYQINFYFEKNDFVMINEEAFYPMNKTIVPCSRAVRPHGPACSRMDCPRRHH